MGEQQQNYNINNVFKPPPFPPLSRHQKGGKFKHN